MRKYIGFFCVTVCGGLPIEKMLSRNRKAINGSYGSIGKDISLVHLRHHLKNAPRKRYKHGFNISVKASRAENPTRYNGSKNTFRKMIDKICKCKRCRNIHNLSTKK